jgi:hypothetical protein
MVKKKLDTHSNQAFNVILLTFIAAYILNYFIWAVSAFYAAGLHLENPSDILDKLFDPKWHYPYSGIAAVGRILGLYSALCINGLLIPIGVSLIYSLRNWNHYRRLHKITTAIILTAGVATILFSLTSLGQLIFEWLAD